MTIIKNVQLGCETVPALRDTRPTENETNRARDNTVTPVLYISKRKKNTIVPVPYLIHHFFRSHLRSHHSRSSFAQLTGSDFPPKSRQVVLIVKAVRSDIGNCALVGIDQRSMVRPALATKPAVVESSDIFRNVRVS